MKSAKQKKCRNKDCGRSFTPYKTTDKYCQKSCMIEAQGYTHIKKVSDKRKIEQESYILLSKAFLQRNPICQYEGCNDKSTDTHHMAGRTGANYLDNTKWKAFCRNHHSIVELNPQMAKENGYSLSRLAK